MANQNAKNSFFTKYKNLNTWNKYSRVLDNRPARQNQYIYHPSYSTSTLNDLGYIGQLPYHFTNDTTLANEVLAKAGPRSVYQDPNFQSYEVGGVRRIITDPSHPPSGNNYKINQDPNPIHVIRPSNAEYQNQDSYVRYLKPPTPEPPGPIVIQERQLPQPPAAPPIYIRQVEPRQPTPPPLLIRERPPTPPAKIEPTYIEKILPARPPPPRQVIIEKIPAKPPKPQTIIYEKWLPYKSAGERQVIVEKAPYVKPATPPRNIIIEYDRPSAIVNKRVFDDGVYATDPNEYASSRYNQEVKYVDRDGNELIPVEYLAQYINKREGDKHADIVHNKLQHSSSAYEDKSERSNTPTRPPSAPYAQHIVIEPKTRPKTSVASTKPRPGPVMYSTPWTTTYKTSYYDKGFPSGFLF